MKCDDAPEKLVSLLYGELEQDEVEKIHDHINICEDCRKAYEELEMTTGLLEKWEDVKFDHNTIFIQQSVSRFKSILEKWQQWTWGRRLAVGFPIIIGILMMSLSIMHFNARYSQGELQISFGIFPKASQAQMEEKYVNALRELQEENLKLMTEMVQASESRQRQQLTFTLNEFARDVEQQRRQDLRMVGQGLEGLHRSTESRFNQTSTILNDLFLIGSEAQPIQNINR